MHNWTDIVPWSQRPGTDPNVIALLQGSRSDIALLVKYINQRLDADRCVIGKSAMENKFQSDPLV